MSDQAQCPLPDCGELLQITVSQSGVVYLDGTADSGLASAWVIGCGQGHVLLLPADDAADYHEYGMDDAARLRGLLASDGLAERRRQWRAGLRSGGGEVP